MLAIDLITNYFNTISPKLHIVGERFGFDMRAKLNSLLDCIYLFRAILGIRPTRGIVC